MHYELRAMSYYVHKRLLLPLAIELRQALLGVGDLAID